MGWNLDTMGMMGFLRVISLAEDGVRLLVRVWSGECILVDFIKTVSKSSRKSMYPGLQEEKGRSESMDCGACIGQCSRRKYKA